MQTTTPSQHPSSRNRPARVTEQKQRGSNDDSEPRHKRPSAGSQIALTDREVYKLEKKGYKFDKVISSGTSGKLFEVYYRPPDKKGGKVVRMACKVIDKDLSEDKFVKKFLPREMAILSRLDHPYCIQTYYILEMNSKCFFFMRFAEHGNLLDYLTENDGTEDAHARAWMRELLLALDYLHNKGIAHRDIKCENILITENMNVKLADFGFSRYWINDSHEEQLSETYCGSLSYAAPEVLLGRPYCPKKVDVWSLGIVLYIMFNVAKPFSKRNPTHVLRLQMQRNYRWTSKGISNSSSNSRNMVANMLEPEYAARKTPFELLRHPWMIEDADLLRLVPDPKESRSARGPSSKYPSGT